MTGERDEFLRRRVPGGRLISRGAVAALVQEVAALERVARPFLERSPARLAHLLGSEVTDDDREAVQKASVRITAVGQALREVLIEGRKGQGR